MAEEMLTLPKFEEASEIVKKVTQETKLVYSKYFSEQTGNKVYLKPENMQLTGAYKLRGAYYKISTLSEEERAKGLITASAGNHAQGVAYAAKCYGAKAVIVMPTTTPLIKVERTQSYGAEVVLYGDVYDEACAKAYELAAEHGYTFIHPFDDLTVATGQGTIAMEVIQELPLVDYILVPIGGHQNSANFILRNIRINTIGKLRKQRVARTNRRENRSGGAGNINIVIHCGDEISRQLIGGNRNDLLTGRLPANGGTGTFDEIRHTIVRGLSLGQRLIRPFQHGTILHGTKCVTHHPSGIFRQNRR